MSKYNIEDNIDFYAELYKSLDDDYDPVNDENMCLISNTPLTDYYVTMECGHKFNYIPLYNDLVNHKKKFNSMERTGRLGKNEIRCPYCRKKQSTLLPYHKELLVKKICGVNFIPQITTSNNRCHICDAPDAFKLKMYNDDNHYCYTHTKTMIKKYKMEEKLFAKQQSKKEKQEKQEKKAKDKQSNENENIENIVLTQKNGCIQILKYGAN